MTASNSNILKKAKVAIARDFIKVLKRKLHSDLYMKINIKLQMKKEKMLKDLVDYRHN